MNVREHRHPEFSTHFGEHFQSGIKARSAK
jgi:hypothetical protein